MDNNVKAFRMVSALAAGQIHTFDGHLASGDIASRTI
jgi:hypothetical protein